MTATTPLAYLRDDDLDAMLSRSTGDELNRALNERAERVKRTRLRYLALDRLWTEYGFDCDDYRSVNGAISFVDARGYYVRTERVYGARPTWTVTRRRSGSKVRRYLGGSSARCVEATSAEAAIVAAIDAGFVVAP